VLLAFGVGSGATDDQFENLLRALGCALAAGPIASVLFGYRARRRVARSEPATEVEGGPPPELQAQLRAVALAGSRERSSYSMLMGTLLAYSLVLALALIAIAAVSKEVTFSKALYKAFTVGWPLPIAMFLAGYAHTRRMTGKNRRRASVWTASAVPFVLYGTLVGWMIAAVNELPALWGVAVIAFCGCAPLITAVPAFWWMTRRLTKERSELAHIALPPRFEDSEEVRRLLTRTVDWSSGPSAIRIDALKALAARLHILQLAPVLDRVLTQQDAQLVQSALRIAAEKHHRPAIERLLAVAERDDDETRALLPPLLQRHRDPRVEGVLVDLVAREAPALKTAAAEALGLVGSSQVVEALRREANAAIPGRVRSACLEAIERIHIRAKGGRGQLALVETGEDGALSYTDDEPGSVSLP
jgi:hypothetical protein